MFYHYLKIDNDSRQMDLHPPKTTLAKWIPIQLDPPKTTLDSDSSQWIPIQLDPPEMTLDNDSRCPEWLSRVILRGSKTSDLSENRIRLGLTRLTPRCDSSRVILGVRFPGDEWTRDLRK